MISKYSKSNVINDPIHNIMRVGSEAEQWVRPFINHTLLQRLRYIKQMGLADLVFPSATHNRFSHSLGTNHIANRIAQQLSLNTKEKQILSITSLLHDVSHGPFSHVFEAFLSNISQETISHEEWVPLFIKEFHNDDFLALYSTLNPKQPLTISDLDLVTSLITGDKSLIGTNSLLADIIASQLDADRMDYLLRDSHFCGVTYGQFDLDWLINCLTVCSTEDDTYRLAITKKGVNVAEQYLLARAQMNRGVYYHKTIVALEYFLIYFLKELLASIQAKDSFLQNINHIPLISFLKEIGTLSKTNKKQLMSSSFQYYRQLCDYDIHFIIRHLTSLNPKKNSSVINLANLLYKRKIPAAFKLKKDNQQIRDLIHEIKPAQKLQDWQINVYQPNFTVYEKKSSPILISDNNKITTLHQQSQTIEHIAKLPWNISFLFIDQNIMDNTEINSFIAKLHHDQMIEAI